MLRRSAAKTKKEPAVGSILQLKIRLLDVNPMIWRRVLVPATYTLEELHGVIRVAMGWEPIHFVAAGGPGTPPLSQGRQVHL